MEGRRGWGVQPTTLRQLTTVQGDRHTVVHIVAASAGFGVTQTWGCSACLSLSFHIWTRSIIRREEVRANREVLSMHRLVMRPLLGLVVPKVMSPLSAH